MGAFTSILNCTLGGVSFQLDDYSVTSDAVWRDGVYAGRNVLVAGEGFVLGNDPTDFAMKLNQVRAAFETIGEDFRITGLGGKTELEIPAARCVEGGPFASYEQLPQRGESALVKRFRFTLEARGVVDASGDGGDDGSVASLSRRVKTSRSVDDLQTVVITGKMFGPNLAGAVEDLIANVRAEFPWPDWILTSDVDANAAYDSLNYAITVKEMASPLPASQAGDSAAIDGEATYTREIDEQGRMTQTWAYDFVVAGDPEELYRMLRPAAVLRESVATTSHQEIRWRATFVVLASAEMDDLLGWECDVETSEEAATGRVETYDGVRSIVLMNSTPVYRIVISGRAVGLHSYPKPPPAPDLQAYGFVLAEPPAPRRTYRSRLERETSWAYSFVGTRGVGATAAAAIVSAMARPAHAEFY